MTIINDVDQSNFGFLNYINNDDSNSASTLSHPQISSIFKKNVTNQESHPHKKNSSLKTKIINILSRKSDKTEKPISATIQKVFKTEHSVFDQIKKSYSMENSSFETEDNDLDMEVLYNIKTQSRYNSKSLIYTEPDFPHYDSVEPHYEMPRSSSSDSAYETEDPIYELLSHYDSIDSGYESPVLSENLYENDSTYESIEPHYETPRSSTHS